MLDHLSISSLQLFKRNPRRWILEYVEKIRCPKTPALEFGTKCHKLLELLFQGKPAQGILDLSSEQLLKDWIITNRYFVEGFHWRQEDRFRIFLRPDLPPFEGAIDLWSYDQNKWLIYDFKTVTRGYEENLETIPLNWQLSLYAHVLNLWPQETDVLKCGHLQFFKNRIPQIIDIKKLDFQLSKKQLDTNIDNLIQLSYSAMEAVKQYRKRGLRGVPYKKNTKYAFGKECEYWPCVQGLETVEECRKRIQNLKVQVVRDNIISKISNITTRVIS